MFKDSKKGVTELISFVLILLVIVVASLSTYIFSKSQLEKNIYSFDNFNFEKKLLLVEQKINQISTFDNSQTSFYLEFKSGQLTFKENQVIYQSLIKSNSNQNVCMQNLCFYTINDFEVISLNLTNLTFNNNMTIYPGNYIFNIRFQKNESKIYLQFQ